MVSTDYVIGLYQRYKDDLKKVRKQQYWFLTWRNNALLRRLYKMRLCRYTLVPMLDDLEAEITYLLIRDRNPDMVVEMSPNSGWSTTWILSALRDNRARGQLWSYDLHDTSTKFVPRMLSSGRWHLVLGDAKHTMRKDLDFDYLFIDSDHTKQFANWYVEALLPRVKPGCLISVHDVFHGSVPSEEGEVVLSWLKKRQLSYWTAARAVSAAITQLLNQERLRLGMGYAIHARSANNSMMFVEVNR